MDVLDLALARLVVVLWLVLGGGCTAQGVGVPAVGITLEVVTPPSHDGLHEAMDTLDIQLRVTVTDEKITGGISLFDCKAVSEVKVEPEVKAVSEVGGDVLQLTDSRGCPAQQSPMGCMVEENGTLVSPVFQLSSLADVGHVTITCSWEECPVPHHPKCMNRCAFFTRPHARGTQDVTRRRGRRQGDRKETPGGRLGDESARRHVVSTTIRVLPSSHVRRVHHHGASFPHHGHRGNGHTQPAGYQSQEHGGEKRQWRLANSNVLLYLNPITCSVFLLLLSVFLGFYVSFVRSLRRSVEDIKREIEAQRSRDKFLVR